jgi:hypothetical protein
MYSFLIVSWLAAHVDIAGMIAIQGTVAWSCASYVLHIMAIETGHMADHLGGYDRSVLCDAGYRLPLYFPWPKIQRLFKLLLG